MKVKRSAIQWNEYQSSEKILINEEHLSVTKVLLNYVLMHRYFWSLKILKYVTDIKIVVRSFYN